MTETLGQITCLSPEDHGDYAKLDAVGRARAGFELKVVDARGDRCDDGESGEIWVRSAIVMTGYFMNPEKTAQAFQGGWYATGDIGFLDEDGYLTLLDRKCNMIISGGENIYPREVTRCIELMGDDVVDVAVLGVPDSRWGESVAAFVALKPGSTITAADVVAHCAHEMGGYKKPKHVVLLPSIERNAMGKIGREWLLEQLADALAQ